MGTRTNTALARARTDQGRPSLPVGRYIAGPFYDWFFFILSPLLALLLGLLVSPLGLDQWTYAATDAAGRVHQIAVAALASAALTHAHLVIVFFRSHLNRSIFRLHPHRFITVPIVLFLASVGSQWVFVVTSVLTVWWDVYHSSLQTFGLGRIYLDCAISPRRPLSWRMKAACPPVLAAGFFVAAELPRDVGSN